MPSAAVVIGTIGVKMDVQNFNFSLRANSADNKLMIFLFFLENRIWHFMYFISLGDNLHEMSAEFFAQHAKC